VGDDQDARADPGGDAIDALGDDPDGVDVEAAVGLVEDREGGAEHGELEDLGPLLLAAGEALVEVTTGEVGVHAQLIHLLAHLLAELAHRDQLLAFLPAGVADVGDRVAEEVGDGDARDRGRVLEGEEQARLGPIIGLHRQEVLAVEGGGAAEDLVIRVPG